jgi:hypothetical protein
MHGDQRLNNFKVSSIYGHRLNRTREKAPKIALKTW